MLKQVNLCFQIFGSTIHSGEVHERQDQREAGGETYQTSSSSDQVAECQQGSLPQVEGSRNDKEEEQGCKLGKKI